MTRRQIKELDRLFSLKVREVGCCEKCRGKGTQAHHIFTRSKRSTRWDTDNGLCLCYRCHFFFAHTDPVEFVRWLEGYVGKKGLEKLRRKSNKVVKGQDFEKIKRSLI